MVFGQPRIHPEPGPMQVRFFKQPDLAELEAAINQWLSTNPRREIVEVRQTQVTTVDRGVEIVVSVWYMED